MKKEIQQLCSWCKRSNRSVVGFGRFARVNNKSVELSEDDLKKEFALHGFAYQHTEHDGMIFKLIN